VSAEWGRIPLACPRCSAVVVARAGGAHCPGCASDYPFAGGILHLTAGGRGAPAYDPHHFAILNDVEERHFWFRARREVVLDALRAEVADLAERPLFDVGCGTGGLLAFLMRSGVPFAGACDAYPQGLALARARVGGPLVLVDEGVPPPLAPGHRLIGMFDVLEHVDDDAGVLRRLFLALEPGGVIVLTVPAHPVLFGEMDELARHRRRYTRAELGRKLREAGFVVRRLTHFMAVMAPLILMMRPLGRLRHRRWPASERVAAELRVGPLANGVLRAWFRLERAWLRARPLPFGSSLLALAVRPRP